jgi:hypothetical protein
MSDDNDKYPCAGWSVLHTRRARRMSDYDHLDPLQLISLLDRRDARIAELEKENERLRNELSRATLQ